MRLKDLVQVSIATIMMVPALAGAGPFYDQSRGSCVPMGDAHQSSCVDYVGEYWRTWPNQMRNNCNGAFDPVPCPKSIDSRLIGTCVMNAATESQLAVNYYRAEGYEPVSMRDACLRSGSLWVPGPAEAN